MNFQTKFFWFLFACITLLPLVFPHSYSARAQSAPLVEASATHEPKVLQESSTSEASATLQSDFDLGRYLTVATVVLASVTGAIVYFWRHRLLKPYEFRFGLVAAILFTLATSLMIRNWMMAEPAHQCMNAELRAGSAITEYDDPCRIARESFADVLGAKWLLRKIQPESFTGGTVAPLSVQTNAWLYYLSVMLFTGLLFWILKFLAIIILYKKT